MTQGMVSCQLKCVPQTVPMPASQSTQPRGYASGFAHFFKTYVLRTCREVRAVQMPNMLQLAATACNVGAAINLSAVMAQPTLASS